MRIISKRSLVQFWNKHKDAEQPLKIWHDITRKSNWITPNDIKMIFNSADFLPGNRVVFNIKGNKYRLIVAIKYEFKVIYIRFIGTHSEYDKIDARTI